MPWLPSCLFSRRVGRRGGKKTRRAPQPSRARLAFEPLEGRICPSVFYDFNVIAKTGDQTQSGDTINSFKSEVSINDSGNVAVVGSLSGPSGTGTSVLVGDGSAATKIISFANPGTARTYSFPTIDNDNKVVASEGISGTFFIRTWDATKQGAYQIITTTGMSPPQENFDTVSLPTRANDGSVGFIGTMASVSGSGLYVNNGPVASGPNDVFLDPLNGGGFRPMAADGGRVVIREGGTATDPIVLCKSTGNITIASTAMGFTSMGRSPGISDNGSVVAFYGDLSAAGATNLNTAQPNLPPLQAGPGIFVSLPPPGGTGPRLIVRVAGTPSDLGFDANGNPITFGSFDVDSRVAVIDQQLNGASGASAAGDSLVISFSGTPSAASRPNPQTGAPMLFTANDGLWTERLDVDADLLTPAQVDYHPTSPIPVVQVGDKINGAVVTSILTHDPLANAKTDWIVNLGGARTPLRGDHMVAFEATTASGTMIVRGSHLDSDQDGLLDQWEAKGIDIDQDGIIDLDLSAMGANVYARDLFLEADWTAPKTSGFALDQWSEEPNAGIFQSLVNMFAAAPALPNGIPAGVTVHVDAGAKYSLNMGTGSIQGGDVIGMPGDPTRHIDVVNLGKTIANIPANVDVRSLDDIKKSYFGTHDKDARELAFHYVVFADFQNFLYNGAGVPISGAVTGATANTLTAAGTPFAGTLSGKVKIVSGKGAGQVRRIFGNTANTLTVGNNWASIPDATSTFVLFNGSSGVAEVGFRADNSSIPGNDQLVTMGGWGGAPNAQGKLASPYLQWRTLAHELGHTLGLRHGGTDHNATKGNSYLSLMSYSFQLVGPPSAVNSYSTTGDMTFNDWGNLQMDFYNSLGHMGNSLALGAAAGPTQDPEPTDVDVELVNGFPTDLVAPTVSINAPGTNATIATSSNLTVNLTATDNVAVDHLTVSFDINGDGNTTGPGETVTAAKTGPTTYTATFTNVSGPAGSRVVGATAYDTSLFATDASVSVNVASIGPFSKYLVSVLGNNAVTAGKSFVFTVQAADSAGNPVISYSGPASVSTSTAPVDAQGNFPVSGPVNGGGFGFFLGNLKTAGTYILSAAAGGFSGSSATISVISASASYFTVTASATATTGQPLDVTVKAFDEFGNLATGYAGMVHFTSTDSAASLPADATLTGGVGVFPATLKTGGSQTITATDTLSIAPTITGTSNVVSTRGLTVSAFTPTATGFTVTFSKPFDPSKVTMYGVGATAQDVTLVGAAGGTSIGGTLIIDPANTSFTFKATTIPLDFINTVVYGGADSVVLPDDTYAVKLKSGVAGNGFFDLLGAGLDGASSGGQADYTATFTTHYQANKTPVLALPDFARGPDDNQIIKIPNNTGHGIPVTLYNAVGLTDATVTISFDPTLLTNLNGLGGAGSDATAAGSTFSLVLTPGVVGQATFTFHSGTPLSGNVILGDILANVPSTAKTNYKAKELIQLVSATVNGGAFTGIAAPGAHVNSYSGDVSGDGLIGAADVNPMFNVAIGAATGFASYSLLDPVIVGDVANDVSVDGGDVATLKSYILHFPRPVIPALPGLTGIVSPSAADPMLSLVRGEGLVVSGQDSSLTIHQSLLTVSVSLDEPHPPGSTGLTEAVLALQYDPSALNVSAADITLGSLTSGGGWQFRAVVDQLTGEIGIEMWSEVPITTNEAGNLVNIAFHALNAPLGTSAVRLVAKTKPQGESFVTTLADDLGSLLLSPGVGQVVLPIN